MKKKVASVLASICLLFVLSACGSSDSNSTTDTTPPTVSEVFEKASADNPAKSSSVTGTLSGEATSDGSSQSVDFTYSADANTDVDNPQAKLTLNDKYDIIVDGETFYVTANDSSVKIDSQALAQMGGGQVPIQNYEDAAKTQKQFVDALKPDFESAGTVESGSSVDGKATWVVSVDLSQVDYRKVIDAYKQTVLENLQAQSGTNPEVQKYSKQIVDQMFNGITDADLNKVKEVAKFIQFDMMFYADEGFLAGMTLSADVTGQELYDAGLIDKGEINNSVKGELKTEITYSDSEVSLDPPTDAPSLATAAGIKALQKAVPSLAPLFSMQQDSMSQAQAN